MNRYTTILDITGHPLYHSNSARLLYLHLCLTAGYHKDDLDIVDKSITRLSIETNLTISATRHALALLQAAGLVTREGNHLKVSKFVQPVLAAPRKGVTHKDGTEEEDKRQRRIQYLTEEIEKLRGWWHEAEKRGDKDSCKEIVKDAAKLKRELTQLQGI